MKAISGINPGRRRAGHRTGKTAAEGCGTGVLTTGRREVRNRVVLAVTFRGRMESLDDARLVAELKNGSESAFEELFEGYKDRIYNTVFRIVGDRNSSEDVVQEVFLKALRNIGSFNEKSTLYTWLYRIAVNASVDFRKKFGGKGTVSIHRFEGAENLLPSRDEAPDREPQRKEMAALLHEAMDLLSEKHRTILVLREFEGLSYEEIAQVLGCSKGTVESRLFRARGRLREKMEKYV